MTNEQKNQIAAMRKDGRSYNFIADALGLSKNTVKSHCKRHKDDLCDLPNDDAAKTEDPIYCRACGKPIPEAPGKKPRKFCSDLCRTTWWNSHLDQVNRKAIYTFTCASCHTTFQAYGNSRRKFCCHACYIKYRFKGGDPA